MKPPCKYCGSSDFVIGKGSDQFKCKRCKKYFSTHDPKFAIESKQSETYEQGKDWINIVCASERILSQEEVFNRFKVNTKEWSVDTWKIKTSEVYRKDANKDLVFDKGKVSGTIEDSGKMLVVPLYHIEVRLIRRTEEVRAGLAKDDFIRDAKKFAPKYKKIAYKPFPKKSGMMYEIDFPDLHFGRLTWEQESGDDYDIKIAHAMANSVVDALLTYTVQFPVSKILLPLGNDFFNVDNKFETTTRGTPQQEDTRWQKTFRKGRELLVEIIDKCSAVAPVDILIIPGNHDETRMFYLGDSLEAWYHLSKDVNVDNAAKKRKYYLFGKNLIGFTHGYWEKLDKLPSLMPFEEPDLFAKSSVREWHTGDKHNKKDLLYITDEGSGMVIRILRSLAGIDTWSFDNGFVGPVKAAEAFLWHPENGLIAQFTAMPKKL